MKLPFSIILQGIVLVLMPVFTLSQIITPNFSFQVSTNFHLIIALIFALSCLRFAEINHPPIFTLFQIIESQI
ncbi:MAG: hypothetical protein LBU14_05105 [Candidatus Peribacteria bacterium]|nr:hypothetical protein [Candidatus Peribacteria bacterium]